ncbi:TetR/AcrR family transcriptional regulator [Streptacidiphilus jiangxiensis]|uniref:DNA-binding transcriptional regulator, AcrR family n=1 Tax=Streptacidiphilus jiangxiensis TaxID=235985 RepID=A0A1H7TLS2_STRJI|nr:TetR/AcrR family transcriptional regulator [Streptacidiphilus jiangxiensis]SEL85525.1 DNA-binding transcriptional regulator, AcrR family [Streptacidiphilus jiangxiensis]
MPTGVALGDPRRLLFDAAERVLLRDGPSALTSRAVTDEADCAKGVLHRHFTDFDAFLAELVLDRIARLDVQAERLRLATGQGDVVDHLTDALDAILDPVALAVVGLVISRDGLRARLRVTRPVGIPLLGDATAVLARHLAAERDLGRLSPGADVDTLAPTLIGAGHLLLADRTGTPPDREALRRVVAGVLAASLD